jgi:hypothetical protein
MNISSYSYLRLIMEYLKHNNYCIKSQLILRLGMKKIIENKN